MLCWPRGAQDLADLRDQRVDVVAHPALAELAEPGQVAADLGRVDVRVVGELLRGDRLLAHLLGLGEHLQVAREAGRHAEREALGAVRLGLRPRGCRPTAPPWARRSSRVHSIEPLAQGVRRRRSSSNSLLAVERRPPGSAPRSGGAARGSSDTSTSSSSNGRVGRHRRDGRARLVAQVAARLAVEHQCATPSLARSVGARAPRPGPVVRVGNRLEEARRRGDHRRVVGAQLERRASTRARPASATARRSSELAATPPPIASRATPSRSSAWRDARHQRVHDRALVGGGQVGAAALGLCLAQVADRGRAARSSGR